MENLNKKRKLSPKKIIIGILVLLFIILVIVWVINLFHKPKSKPAVNSTTGGNVVVDQSSKEEYVSILSDGTRQNKSTKIKEAKRLEVLEISNMNITTKDNLSTVIANVKNTSNETVGEFLVNLKFVDKEGKEIISIDAYVNRLGAGEEGQITTQATADFANSYDYEIIRK